MSLEGRALTMVLVAWATALSFRFFLRFAISRDIVARPNIFVRSQGPAVPYLGGPALFVVLLPVLIVLATAVPTGPHDQPGARWIFTACVLVIGLLDDLRPLSVIEKSLALLVVCSGYLVATSSEPFNALRFGLELSFLLVIVNAFNLVDVSDGVLIVAGSVAAIGLLGGSFLTSPLNRIECVVLLGALAAAYRFNGPPARIYLGDAGALPLGFFLATLFLAGFSESTDTDGFAHIGAFAIPLFELSLIAPARVRRGLSPFRGSADHFALRLHEQGGWSKERVLATSLVLGLFFSVWCFVPSQFIRGPIGVAYAAATTVLGVAAYAYCWRMFPPRASPTSSDGGVSERSVREEG
jgi:UDP-GlcNAc:undecaprenyl-phosphate GlcNAc-1-phosphate transferase